MVFGFCLQNIDYNCFFEFPKTWTQQPNFCYESLSLQDFFGETFVAYFKAFEMPVVYCCLYVGIGAWFFTS